MAAVATTPKPQYYAVRKCDSLKTPAIFWDWDDCSFYLDKEENDDEVDYQVFGAIAQALDYLTRNQWRGTSKIVF
jgi:hypothetical protein